MQFPTQGGSPSVGNAPAPADGGHFFSGVSRRDSRNPLRGVLPCGHQGSTECMSDSRYCRTCQPGNIELLFCRACLQSSMAQRHAAERAGQDLPWARVSSVPAAPAAAWTPRTAAEVNPCRRRILPLLRCCEHNALEVLDEEHFHDDSREGFESCEDC